MGSEETKSLPTQSHLWPSRKYLDFYENSIKEPEAFWEKVATELVWFRTWDKTLEWNYPFAKWFAEGKINASYNCVDRHITGWRGNKAAYIWEGEDGERRTLTYRELYREVNRIASALQNLGVKTGDLLIHNPQIAIASTAKALFAC